MVGTSNLGPVEHPPWGDATGSGEGWTMLETPGHGGKDGGAVAEGSTEDGGTTRFRPARTAT
jgi:N-acetylmuramoyl-L-alanine amidase